jgi:cell division protein FtsN
VRVKKDAEVFIEQFKSKGHPAFLSDTGDGWFRVFVGPFRTSEEATAYQQRLKAEGFQSLVRKR